MNTSKMKNKVAIGISDFSEIIEKNVFYVDKTNFIKDWWESYDSVTLITRPRRFGKTLNMSMVEYFFSNKYSNQEKIFGDLDVWKDKEMRELAGSYPVIFLSFASVKQSDFESCICKINEILKNVIMDYDFLLDSTKLSDFEKKSLLALLESGTKNDFSQSVLFLSKALYKHFGKKVIIALDEYDTPMQEALINGYWDEITNFIRGFFNSTFKTNTFLERALLTGITRVAKESIFSDFNNAKVITTMSNKYVQYFGFTEEEVFAAMDTKDLDNKSEVKKWYDGYTFGKHSEIYNPWSIINYLDEQEILMYWVNTSSNKLISDVIRKSDGQIKRIFEDLFKGKDVETKVDDQVNFSSLQKNNEAILGLLVSAGYLTVKSFLTGSEDGLRLCHIQIPNLEVKALFVQLIREWFNDERDAYSRFTTVLINGNIREINEILQIICNGVISSFDVSGRKDKLPEKFYHGLVLGMIVSPSENLIVRSNRESGYGRYDVMLYRKDFTGNGIIIEFKVKSNTESSLEETAQRALDQIEEKNYEAELKDLGYTEDRIKKYGFAFEGKKVLVSDSESLNNSDSDKHGIAAK